MFGVVVLAAVVGLAGGIIRDVLIGTPPSTFRDWRYLAAAAAAGVVCFFAGRVLERAERSVMVFDALGLGLFAVAGASKALQFGLGPVQAVLLGTITGVGGGVLRDVLLCCRSSPRCTTRSGPRRRGSTSWSPWSPTVAR